MTSPFPLRFTAAALKSFARPRVKIFILWAFVFFGGIQGWLWWGLDASASMPVGSLFLSSSLPSPPLPKPNQSNPCKSMHQNLFDAQQTQLKFCESTPLREDASSPSSPRYLQALRLTCPLSALSLGNRQRTITQWVAEKDRNVTLFGYAEKDKVSRDIAMHGYWEMENMSVLLLLLERARWQRREWRHPESPSRPPRRDELVMLDVGGNLGAYTLCLATAGFRVLTFEAMRRNIEAIREGICRNSGLKERVILLEKGLAEKEETCTLVVDKENIGDGITRCQGRGVSLGSEVREDAIQVTTLDRALYCPQSSRDAVPSFYTGRPAALKMDVEGFEMLVVQGGQGFLNTSDLAVVLHENGHMPFEKRKYLLEYFVDRGYVFLCPEEMYEWVDGRGGKRGRKRKVPKIEAFAEFDERIFDCWDIAWVKKEDVEVEAPRGGRGQRYWLLLD